MLGASKAIIEGKFTSTFSLEDVRNVLDMTLEAVETNVMAFESDSTGKEQILVHTRHGLYMTGVMCSAMIFESLPVSSAALQQNVMTTPFSEHTPCQLQT